MSSQQKPQPRKKLQLPINQSALDIYNDLIKRIKAKVRSEISVVFDPDTGIQKAFLHGKLLWVKKVRDV